jgi:hypothetical protein
MTCVIHNCEKFRLNISWDEIARGRMRVLVENKSLTTLITVSFHAVAELEIRCSTKP